MVKYKNLNVSVLYFFVHFILEVTTFYILSSYMSSNLFWYIALAFDFFAFVPQALVGSISDKYRNIRFGLIGVVFTTISLLLLFLKMPLIPVIFFLTIGNCMIHVEGAESTLRTSEGTIFPASLFVSGGAFGIIVGKLLYKFNFSIIYIILCNILSFIIMIYASKYKKNEHSELKEFDFANKKVNYTTIIALATLVVMVRSYMSYGIPTEWNKTVIEAVLLYCSMGLGKAIGGLLVDNIGIKKTILLSTLLSLPFLMFGDNVMTISLIGIMLFSMTMAITLAILVSVLPKRPGLAFGFTTIGLFLGALPVFIFRIESVIVNAIIFTILTICCIVVLDNISKGSR
ncbi:MAG: hypothetical protein IJL74_02475 [Bacilli bacterium]|nr:hypothetical protein [Bacilli bacterium]